MRRLLALSLLLLAFGCSGDTPTDPAPSLEDGHVLPHALPCHATETQDAGGYQGGAGCVAAH